MRVFSFILLFLWASKGLALINGTTLNGVKDIVRLRMTNGWVCSGVFIDPYTILTAAHCISPTNYSDKLSIENIESADDVILDLEITKLIPHPKYRAQHWPSYDVGIIKTSQNLKFEGLYQLQENLNGLLKKAILIGCGKTEYKNKIYACTSGENSFLQLGTVLIFIGESVAGKADVGTRVSIAPNDSGGPILEKETGKIVGVMSTTTLKDSLSYGLPTIGTGSSTSVEENLQFIKSSMGYKD